VVEKQQHRPKITVAGDYSESLRFPHIIVNKVVMERAESGLSGIRLASNSVQMKLR
jgi:hypothetical protein